jgi:hypothetical protein
MRAASPPRRQPHVFRYSWFSADPIRTAKLVQSDGSPTALGRVYQPRGGCSARVTHRTRSGGGARLRSADGGEPGRRGSGRVKPGPPTTVGARAPPSTRRHERQVGAVTAPAAAAADRRDRHPRTASVPTRGGERRQGRSALDAVRPQLDAGEPGRGGRASRRHTRRVLTIGAAARRSMHPIAAQPRPGVRPTRSGSDAPRAPREARSSAGIARSGLIRVKGADRGSRPPPPERQHS